MNHTTPTTRSAEITFGSHKMVKDGDGEWVQVELGLTVFVKFGI